MTAGQAKTVAIAIGPEFGTVGPELIRDAAKEAVRFADLLVVCGFAFDPLAGEEASTLGRLTLSTGRTCRRASSASPITRPTYRPHPGNNRERRSSQPTMDPNADVETTSTATVPGPLTAVRIGVAGGHTGAAYERHAAEVYGFLVRTVRDADAAADLLADAFTKLLVEERGGRWPDYPRAWLYRVASNLAMSRGRHLQVAARVDRVLQARHQDQGSDSPDVVVLRHERRSDLDRALGLLGADARVALLLAAQGFDGATIAATIGRTAAATRTLMCKARMRLRDELREDHR